MERIKQALEKARQERQLAGGSLSPSNVKKSAVTAATVSYTQTRTMQTQLDDKQNQRIVGKSENNAFTDAYKVLRTQVLQRLHENDWNTLALTSAGNEEGKTLTAINLGLSLAMEVNYTVLLVDTNLRNPSVHNFFGLQPEYGLSDYLTDDVPLTELLIHPADYPRFVLLPAGKPLSNSSEMLGSPKMVKLVKELKARYPSRIVLFDLPPLLATADALAFSPYVDAALLVIEEGKTQARDINQAMELLQVTNVIGTVLNKSGKIKVENDNNNTSWEKFSAWLSRLFKASWRARLPLRSWFKRPRRKGS